MGALIKALFSISDLFAWLLVTFAAVSAAAFPFAEVVPGRQFSISAIVAGCLMWAFTAVGAYGLTRRKLIGLAPATLPGWVALLSGHAGFGLALLGLAALVFGTPFLLVFMQARRTGLSGPAA
ncbi:hypothetical protein GCM10027430_35890 [Lysobacter tyrosinilyticus]